MSNFMIIRPVGAELFHVSDGQTDVTKLKNKIQLDATYYFIMLMLPPPYPI